MKKIITVISIIFLTVLIVPNKHIHNKECGYDFHTGKGCIYEISLYQDKYGGD